MKIEEKTGGLKTQKNTQSGQLPIPNCTKVVAGVCFRPCWVSFILTIAKQVSNFSGVGQAGQGAVALLEMGRLGSHREDVTGVRPGRIDPSGGKRL